MKTVVLFLAVLVSVLLSGCSHHRECVHTELCYKVQAPPADYCAPEVASPSMWQAIFEPTPEIRSARLKLAAAVVLIAGEIALEVIKAHH